MVRTDHFSRKAVYSKEYLSPPNGDHPGERVELLKLFRKILDSCSDAFPGGAP
jgi:hypothetical protein